MKNIILIAIFSLTTCNFIGAQIEEHSNLDTDNILLIPQYYHLRYDVSSSLHESEFKFDIVLPFSLYYSSVKNPYIDTIGLKWVLDHHGIDSTAQAFYCVNSDDYYNASIAIIPRIIGTGTPYPYFEELKLIYYEYSWEIVKEGVIIEYPDGTKIKTVPIQDTVYDEVCITIVTEPKNREAISTQRKRISKEDHDKYLRFMKKYDLVPLRKE